VLKTSVYLPPAVKDRLADVARRTGRSEANLIRAAIERLLDDGAGLGRAVYTRPEDPTARRQGAALVGVGVGPGDPSLVTLRAVAALRGADRVFAPVTSDQSVGRAEAIAREAVPDVRIERLVFVMAPDASARTDAIDAAAARVCTCLDAGEQVAFITIGDPNVYSTFSAVSSAVQARRPGTPITTVPGIMAFQDLAARSGTVLVDERQTLTLVTGLDGTVGIDAALSDPCQAVVVYKGGRRLAEITDRVRETGRRAVVGELLGLPGERIGPLGPNTGAPMSYLSTVIVPPAPGEDGQR
jgi:precorrin-2/cobalt-factor-2 C20-methyltransferase